MLDHGAHVHQTTEGCCEADVLYWAITEGSASPEVIKLLIDTGANIDSFNSCMNISALAEAAAKDNHIVVKLLLDHGANINYQGPGEEGTTPLMAAAREGHLGMVKLLLQRGADPLLTDLVGDTARSIALKKEHKEIAKLLSGGQTTRTKDKGG